MGGEDRHTGIDQAALLAALLAVFFQLTGEPGPWSPVNTGLGLILLLIIASYAQPTRGRRWGPLYLQVLSVAVGAALSLCLVVAWPAQQSVVDGLARATGSSVDGDDLGDYTTWYVFPVVLILGSWAIYRFILRKISPPSTLPRGEVEAGSPPASPMASDTSSGASDASDAAASRLPQSRVPPTV